MTTNLKSYSAAELKQLAQGQRNAVRAFRRAGDTTTAGRLLGCGAIPANFAVVVDDKKRVGHRHSNRGKLVPAQVLPTCGQHGCMYCGGPDRWRFRTALASAITTAKADDMNVMELVFTCPRNTPRAPKKINTRTEYVRAELNSLFASKQWLDVVGENGAWATAIETTLASGWTNTHAHVTAIVVNEAAIALLNSVGPLKVIPVSDKSTVNNADAWARYVSKGFAGSDDRRPALMKATDAQWDVYVEMVMYGDMSPEEREAPVEGKAHRHRGVRLLSLHGHWKGLDKDDDDVALPTVMKGNAPEKAYTPTRAAALEHHAARPRRPATLRSADGEELTGPLTVKFISPHIKKIVAQHRKQKLLAG